MTRVRRVIGSAFVATLVLAGLTAGPAHAATSRAVVVVDTGSATVTRVISFDGTISGYEALELAGAAPATYGFAGQGIAVCQLFGVGNPADDTCLGTGDDPRYWAYYRAPAGSGGWQYARGGAGATTVSDGDVEGWRFGTGGAPGFRTFCDVADCAPPTPPAAPESPAAPGATVGGASADRGGAGGDPAPAITEAGSGADPSGGPSGAAGDSAAGTADPDPAAAPVSDRSGPRAGGGRSRDVQEQARGPAPVAADGGGTGSPVGVVVALALVALIAVAGFGLRRRSRSAD